VPGALDTVTGVGVGLLVPAEQPTATGTTAARATALHNRGRYGRQRTPSIYATLAAVMERTGFWECCRR
jgi:hypothetical protein